MAKIQEITQENKKLQSFIEENSEKHIQSQKEIDAQKEEALKENARLKEKLDRKKQKKKEIVMTSRKEIIENKERLSIEIECLKNQLTAKNSNNSAENIKSLMSENQKLKELLDEKSQTYVESLREFNGVNEEKEDILKENIRLMEKLEKRKRKKQELISNSKKQIEEANNDKTKLLREI